MFDPTEMGLIEDTRKRRYWRMRIQVADPTGSGILIADRAVVNI